MVGGPPRLAVFPYAAPFGSRVAGVGEGGGGGAEAARPGDRPGAAGVGRAAVDEGPVAERDRDGGGLDDGDAHRRAVAGLVVGVARVDGRGELLAALDLATSEGQ